MFGTNRDSALGALIDATQWIDTHEHLVEERLRLGDSHCRLTDACGYDFEIPGDWVSLITLYPLDDMVSAGLPASVLDGVLGTAWSPLRKWDAVADYLEATRHSGAMRAVDLSTERLLGARLSRSTCVSIGEQLVQLRTPGFYRRVLQDSANVERCQVHSIEGDPFSESEYPQLLEQDIVIAPLVYGSHARAEGLSGIDVASLDDYLEVIEWCFAQYGSRAVAVKSYWAYHRPLAVSLSEERPAAAFERLRAGTASPEERRAVEDFLFLRCLDLAASHGLPVKLHLGTLGSNSLPALRWVRDHVHDVTPLVQGRPQNQFVLMHSAWPHSEQLLALAKHQPNVTVDLSWTWILNPLATVEFVRRFLTVAPTTKLLCFGGDYLTVESVVGHAEIARRGLQRALESLVDDDWLTSGEAEALVPKLMRGNAERLFPQPS